MSVRGLGKEGVFTGVNFDITPARCWALPG
jgi:hypothetical protein